jgi:hypothetical protein
MLTLKERAKTLKTDIPAIFTAFMKGFLTDAGFLYKLIHIDTN